MNRNKRQRTSAMYSTLLNNVFDRAWDDPEKLEYGYVHEGEWLFSSEEHGGAVTFHTDKVLDSFGGTNQIFVSVNDCVQVATFKDEYFLEYDDILKKRTKVRRGM